MAEAHGLLSLNTSLKANTVFQQRRETSTGAIPSTRLPVRIRGSEASGRSALAGKAVQCEDVGPEPTCDSPLPGCETQCVI